MKVGLLIAVLLCLLVTVTYSASIPATKYSSALATQWFQMLYDLIKLEKTGPPPASRIYGIMGVSLYQSIVNGMPGYFSLAGQLNSLSETPSPSSSNIHWGLAANSALAHTAETLFASASENGKAMIANIKTQLHAQMAEDESDDVVSKSTAYGISVATAVLSWASTDGISNTCIFVPPTTEGSWVPTPPAFAAPALPCWGNLRNMVLPDINLCAPVEPVTYSSDSDSAFYDIADEVYQVGISLTADQTFIAKYWNDAGAITGTPSGHWFSIASQILKNKSSKLHFAAIVYASLGIAITDAFIECWNTKYTYNVLRPITYIRANIPDAEAWTSLLTTPPFPDYTSGHSTQSAAASVVLTHLFGASFSFTDETHDIHNPELALGSRTFTSFEAAAGEATVSRLYGGIHYRPANENGAAAGSCIAGHVISDIQFGSGSAHTFSFLLSVIMLWIVISMIL